MNDAEIFVDFRSIHVCLQPHPSQRNQSLENQLRRGHPLSIDPVKSGVEPLTRSREEVVLRVVEAEPLRDVAVFALRAEDQADPERRVRDLVEDGRARRQGTALDAQVGFPL